MAEENVIVGTNIECDYLKFAGKYIKSLSIGVGADDDGAYETVNCAKGSVAVPENGKEDVKEVTGLESASDVKKFNDCIGAAGSYAVEATEGDEDVLNGSLDEIVSFFGKKQKYAQINVLKGELTDKNQNTIFQYDSGNHTKVGGTIFVEAKKMPPVKS